jgi:hypothetical protein
MMVELTGSPLIVETLYVMLSYWMEREHQDSPGRRQPS